MRSRTLGLEVLEGRLAIEGEGEMGKIASSSEKMGLGGTMTGNVIVCDGDGEDKTDDVDEDGGVVVRTGNDGGKVGRPAITPCVWRVRRIVSHAVSSVRTRSRSARVSASRAASAARCSALSRAIG
jgi:hypothetical protein